MGIHNPSASSLSSIFLIGMCLGESGQRRKSLRQNPGMKAGDNLDVGASFDQALVKPNKRRSILDPVITCDPRGVLDSAVLWDVGTISEEKDAINEIRC